METKINNENRQANVLKYQDSNERMKFKTQAGKIAKIDFFKRHCSKFVGKDNKILDIGGGGGVWTDIIREEGITDKIYAVDISESVLRERNGKDICVVGDMEKLPFLDNEFDQTFFFAALHHVKNTDIALREAVRVTKPNGKIMLYEPISLRLLIKNIPIEATPDGVEYCFSLAYLWEEVKKIKGQIEFVYFEGFFKRLFRNSQNVDSLKGISKIEEFINTIPVLKIIFGFFAEAIIITVKITK